MWADINSGLRERCCTTRSQHTAARRPFRACLCATASCQYRSAPCSHSCDAPSPTDRDTYQWRLPLQDDARGRSLRRLPGGQAHVSARTLPKKVVSRPSSWPISRRALTRTNTRASRIAPYRFSHERTLDMSRIPCLEAISYPAATFFRRAPDTHKLPNRTSACDAATPLHVPRNPCHTLRIAERLSVSSAVPFTYRTTYNIGGQ